MLERWRDGFLRMSRAGRATIAAHYETGTVGRERLFLAMEQLRVMQADIAVLLLRANHLRDAEVLTGVRIVRIRSGVPPAVPLRPQAKAVRAPRITWVRPGNPRAEASEAHERYKLFVVGRTLEEFTARGGTRRDIRRALRLGWIKLEDKS